jgi:predicted permease
MRLLAGAVGLLLLMLCANIAGLMTARNATRREELAIRLAVGATRGRLLRQMMTETVFITAIGALAGVAAAYAASPLLAHAIPPVRDLSTRVLPLDIDFTPDHRVLIFAAAASLVTALFFGLPPAIVASRSSLDAVLRQARSTPGWRTRQALVVIQMGLCTVLLAGAAMLVRTFEQLRATNPGFDSDHIVVFSCEPSLSGYSRDQAGELARALMERIRAMPDVTGVATATIAPMRGSGMKMTVAPAGQRATRADFLNTSTNSVSPEYFNAMGIRVLAGRSLTEADESKKQPVRVVVNQAFARRFFPGAAAVGRTFGHSMEVTAQAEYEIVGLVSDAKYRSLREPMTPTVYTVARAGGAFQLIVRTRGRPEGIIQPVRDALRSLDAALPFSEIRTLAADADASAAAERTTAEAASAFGVLAALLSALGIYALLAYAVTQRRREIAIRMALGARPAQVGEWVAGQALAMVLAGVALGVGGALLIRGVLRPLLYGIAPDDPVSLAFAAGLVIVVAATATLVPTTRAARVDPAAALRTD